VPFTLIAFAPTNKRLEDRDLDTSSDLARHLLKRWRIALLLMIFFRP